MRCSSQGPGQGALSGGMFFVIGREKERPSADGAQGSFLEGWTAKTSCRSAVMSKNPFSSSTLYGRSSRFPLIVAFVVSLGALEDITPDE